MSYKNIIGYCLLGSLILYCVADIGYAHFGWWTVVTTPIAIALIVAGLALINWLSE